MGLRAKSLAALLLCCVLAVAAAGVAGWQVVQGIRDGFGTAYARNTTLLNRDKVFSLVSHELTLSLRLARSEFTRDWLLHEEDPVRRRTFFREAEGFRADFHDHSYWVGAADSSNYYFNNESLPFSDAPRMTLDPGNRDDLWFFRSMADVRPFNLNVDHDVTLNLTKIWFNVAVFQDGRKIGMAGTGLDLGKFLHDFAQGADAGVTPIIIDQEGAIQAHPDDRLIAYKSGAEAAASRATQLFGLLGGADDERAVRQAMEAAQRDPGSVSLPTVTLQGKGQMLALTFLPDLNWFVLSAVDLEAAHLVRQEWLMPLVVAFAILVGALLLGFAFAVDKLLLGPVKGLQRGALAIAEGRYEVDLPTGRRDEIGDLSRAFGSMAARIRQHTAELEGKVEERTIELLSANRTMAAARKQIDDSINYAGLIQRAILPDRELDRVLGRDHCVLWRPRDVVGGDFYVFRADGDRFLLGIADCAGHGVAGALMTMLGHAAVQQALSAAHPASPATVLAETDAIMRSMLYEQTLPSGIATGMDAGLCYVDPAARILRFAGAKIPLFWSDGDKVNEAKGHRRPLNDRRRGTYRDVEVPLTPGRTFYLVTDGFVDQSGGEHGFAFGTQRLAAMLGQHSHLPLAEQAEAFETVLNDYRGATPQRDDVAMLLFRLGEPGAGLFK